MTGRSHTIDGNVAQVGVVLQRRASAREAVALGFPLSDVFERRSPLISSPARKRPYAA
jgi:hypothetical protein